MQDSLLAELSAEAETTAQAFPDNLSRLRQLAGEVAQLDREIDELEQQLSEKKATRNRILSRDMIDVMDECAVDSIVAGGYSYAASEYCKASIGAQHPNPGAAYAYLEQEGAGDLINRTVEVRFPRGFEDEVEALARHAREHYQMAEVSISKGVPWARLTSWVKEQRKAGQDLPLELLGATVGRVVKVKPSKE
jgi:hypothetical protein